MSRQLDMLDRFASELESHHRILLTTHENPDGDGTGSLLALAHFLDSLGKEPRLVVTPELPSFLEFLDPDRRVEVFAPDGRHRELAGWPDAWILVDASEPHRMGALHPVFAASAARKFCLDHHLGTGSAGFDVAVADPSASASAELVFDLVSRRLERPFPSHLVHALYAGLVDDTGNFRFSNTSPKVHHMAAQLIEDGADPARVYQELYHQGRPERLRLFGKAYAGLQILGAGRYGRLSLRQADLEACGAIHDDMEGLVNEPLKLKGVEVSALLYEMPDRRIKVSLRSRGRLDVNAICRRFGGGGHRLASGARLDGTLDRVQTEVDEAVLAGLATLA